MGEAQKIDNGWEWDCLVAERDALLARVASLEAKAARQELKIESIEAEVAHYYSTVLKVRAALPDHP